MFDVEWIKGKVLSSRYYLTHHGEQKRQNENLTIQEVEESLLNGIILEQYDSDVRGNSCLVVGFTNGGKPVHTVCGEFDEQLAVITLYIPTPPKFKNPYERG